MRARAGLAVLLLTFGTVSASGQGVQQPADSVAVRADTESRFAASFLLGTLGSAAGLFVGGAAGWVLAGEDEEGFNDFHGLGHVILGAAIGSSVGSGLAAGAGAGSVGVWPVLGGAIGCLAGIIILNTLDVSETQAIVYFPIQGLAAALFVQTRR